MKLLNVMIWALFHEPKDIPKCHFGRMVDIAWLGVLGFVFCLVIFMHSVWRGEGNNAWMAVMGGSVFALIFYPLYLYLAHRYHSERNESGET
jgi:membrane protein YdbS with pleckstrin-like domain